MAEVDMGTATAPVRITSPSAAKWLSRKLLVDLFMLVEATLILLVGIVLAKIYVDGTLQVPRYYATYAFPIVLYTGLIVFWFHTKGLYDFTRMRDFVSGIGDVLAGLMLAFACVLVVNFAFNMTDAFSRIWMVGWLGLSALTVLFLRALAARVFSNLIARGLILQATVIYGPREHAVLAAERMTMAGTGVSIVGLFGPNGQCATRQPKQPLAVQGSPDAISDRGGLEALLDYARSHRVDAIVVVADPGSMDDLETVVSALSALPIEVRLIVMSARDGMPLLGNAHHDGLRCFDIQAPPIEGWGWVAKSVLDRAAAAFLLAVVGPLMLAIAIAIRVDSPGPALFLQQRHGLNQKVFRIFKFRTMRVMEDSGDVVQASRGDARITHLGAWLRRTSLDELPQLFNVIRGEMSLVGPRPHPLTLNAEYEERLNRYGNRHKVKPGITGLAQIRGYRGPTDSPDAMRHRLESDLRYIETWSLWLDVKILVATPFLGIVNRNAF